MGAECEKCCSMGDDATDFVPGSDNDPQSKNYTNKAPKNKNQ